MDLYERNARAHERAFKRLSTKLAKRVRTMPEKELRRAVASFVDEADTNVVCDFAVCVGIDLERL